MNLYNLMQKTNCRTINSLHFQTDLLFASTTINTFNIFYDTLILLNISSIILTTLSQAKNNICTTDKETTELLPSPYIQYAF